MNFVVELIKIQKEQLSSYLMTFSMPKRHVNICQVTIYLEGTWSSFIINPTRIPRRRNWRGNKRKLKRLKPKWNLNPIKIPCKVFWFKINKYACKSKKFIIFIFMFQNMGHVTKFTLLAVRIYSLSLPSRRILWGIVRFDLLILLLLLPNVNRFNMNEQFSLKNVLSIPTELSFQLSQLRSSCV